MRKIIMLNNQQNEKYLVREFIIKGEEKGKSFWVLLRNVNEGNCKAWFNVANGEIGKIEGGGKVKSEKLQNGFYKFTLANKLQLGSKREWFYISFVSENGSYSWSNGINENVFLQLKEPNLYIESGEDLLISKNLLNFKITDFSNLENYAHSTYFGLIFIFALIVFIFNSFLNKWVRFIVIILNVFFIITLASKAIFISLVLLLPVYCLFNYFNYRYLIVIIAFGCFLSFNGHVKERFSDMFKTFVDVNKNNELGDLAELSTNNRIFIYKNYINLIEDNFIVGYGYKNGEKINKFIYNYNFNTHNQYLQSLFHSGVMGLASLILFCISPFLLVKNKKNKKPDFELFIVIILFNFLFESLLFRQWGLILICFCYAIYFQFFKSELKWFR
ncbi:O-antigen ligase [uncultured Polaribacter sp.]|uniref:O-antigen ligase family protein n=1 Tax=uncultured Polaribacter sp. TaxID=174711 RepID=UPI002633B1C0|nr:O-antigen ligase family protein [uncultured Polaribacter sp.]